MNLKVPLSLYLWSLALFDLSTSELEVYLNTKEEETSLHVDIALSMSCLLYVMLSLRLRGLQRRF